MSRQTKRTNPKYTLEFKQDAARLVNEKGYTHQQVVDHLGVSLSAIGRWSRAERRSVGVPPGQKATLSLSDQSELMRLRRENEQFRMEREIIKKAAGDSIGHCNTAEIFCDGDKKFNVFLGRSFNSSAIMSSCSCE